jgi:hypothetical protein
MESRAITIQMVRADGSAGSRRTFEVEPVFDDVARRQQLENTVARVHPQARLDVSDGESVTFRDGEETFVARHLRSAIADASALRGQERLFTA